MSHPMKEPPKAESLSLKDEAVSSKSSSVAISLLLSSCVELSGATVSKDKAESCAECIGLSGGVEDDGRYAEALARGAESCIVFLDVELRFLKKSGQLLNELSRRTIISARLNATASFT